MIVGNRKDENGKQVLVLEVILRKNEFSNRFVCFGSNLTAKGPR